MWLECLLDKAGKAARDKHSSSLQKIVNYRQKVLKLWVLVAML
jgi:hypothetical protein